MRNVSCHRRRIGLELKVGSRIFRFTDQSKEGGEKERMRQNLATAAESKVSQKLRKKNSVCGMIAVIEGARQPVSFSPETFGSIVASGRCAADQEKARMETIGIVSIALEKKKTHRMRRAEKKNRIGER